jgi:hypothetical protein
MQILMRHPEDSQARPLDSTRNPRLVKRNRTSSISFACFNAAALCTLTPASLVRAVFSCSTLAH